MILVPASIAKEVLSTRTQFLNFIFLRCFEASKLKLIDFKHFVFIFENAGKLLLLCTRLVTRNGV